MLDSFLPYINNIVKVLPLHQVLPGVTRGGLGSLCEIEHPASPPSPKAREKILQGIQKASRGINQQLPWGEGVDISLILGFTDTFQAVIDLILLFRKTQSNSKSPNSVYMKERDSPVFKHRGVWGSLGPCYPCRLTEAYLP